MIGTKPRLGNFLRRWRGARALAAALASLLLAACAQIWYATLGSADSTHDLAVRRGIVFDADHALKLDVYAPHAASAAPVVVFFYGGSWEEGRRRWYRYVGEALASHGVVAVIPDYRKFPTVRFPEFMVDAANATKWTFEHAAEFGGDARRIFVSGHSAGGHIAALLACDKRYLAAVGLAPRDLAGMIGLAGAYAFLPYVDDEAEIFGDDAKGRYDSQPINFVDGDEPPLLLLQGLDDDEVTPNNAEAMAEREHAMNGSAVLKLYPGADHGDLLVALAHGRNGKPPVLRDMLDFIARPPRR
ncbi:MAG: alpha/beta hydrolase [Proteobacteria bacterium]|uniref:alpha/beta hydrolase n=1 Tax=Rudaea sp. TaxID=2136325 RepID=UPI001E003384|nr:alpha/beta hydrolase [Pseudomonadota bacterium]MBS0565916.1 alpha/beta hydrolase [Pseudomonadota bacterium]